MSSEPELRLRTNAAGHVESKHEKDNDPHDVASKPLSPSSPVDMAKDKKESYSCGRTPKGVVFRVPATREMVQSLLDPREKKSFFDKITLAIMAVEILLFFVLPRPVKQILFIFVFAFWRLGYNVGLGILLKYQSDSRALVHLAKKYQIFDQKANPALYQWLQRQLSMKMGDDYNFTTVPIEYNTWLLFRQLVDIVLMNDFTSYMCFALSWFNWSPQSSFFVGDVLRWAGGLFLIVFNIWVKIDAQRVVKDFAWYWGDFFFLIEQSLTFDGVFEMAPHPMYSVGYFGYYGLSLICASYTVLFVSIAAHALQFLFLALVETPHIDKIYNPPIKAKRQPVSPTQATIDDASYDAMHYSTSGRQFSNQYFRRDLIMFKNFDFFRPTDLASALVMLYSLALPFLMSGRKAVVFAVLQAFAWRIFHTYGLGWILRAQSTNKYFTRHFVKWGGGTQEAFQNWKSLYNLSLCMTYITFCAACWKLYSLPEHWTYGTTLLRHTLGLFFILLHIWTSVSIYEVLGDFGWFYGDFFIEAQDGHLLYTGIYRFLNNPEKVMGHAAFWGMTLMTNSWIIYGLTLFSQISNFLFLHYVEAPHMRKLYGDEIRKEAGLTKTLRSAATSIPKTIPDKLQQEVSKLLREKAEIQAASKNVERVVKETMEKMEKAMGETAGAVNDIMEIARPRLQEAIAEAKTLLDTSRSRLIPIVANDIETYDLSRYSISLSCNNKTAFTLGQPIQIEWTAPEYHGARDWIGIYKVTANTSKKVTNISSHGYWHWTNAVEREGMETLFPPEVEIAEKGTLVFKGNQLPWEVGTYEFRYHHDAKHNVMAQSAPFEIIAPVAPNVEDVNAVELSLLKLVQNALGLNPDIMPVTPLEEFVSMEEREAKHIVYGIKLMYGVEFAWEVVVADKCVARIARRIHHAIEALSPFASQWRRVSMSTPELSKPSLSSDSPRI
ncbi:phospholipid methyltransferase-domain-containing protein [Radiomyces spectabilis]|uniref:phospholipid methyltransferase-domain-containing protein n=1 Tax=Radiomyces spectabilis TaxID=64574 RepID=UPI00221F6481|nr:phospholipid methyltransferase-domain-containing protein [Radiomyces spectabilis]KAI8373027.1 phospholipid methyltransferase-domain-containing protein [Radiomyces spectabilis]